MSHENDEDKIGQVLAANHAVEIWNYPDEILLRAASGWQNARQSESLRTWIAARLKQKLAADRWRAAFAEVEPCWPQAVPFPIADQHCGKMGFVSMNPEQLLPPAKYDVAPCVPWRTRSRNGLPAWSAANSAKRMDFRTRSRRIDRPGSGDGQLAGVTPTTGEEWASFALEPAVDRRPQTRQARLATRQQGHFPAQVRRCVSPWVHDAVRRQGAGSPAATAQNCRGARRPAGGSLVLAARTDARQSTLVRLFRCRPGNRGGDGRYRSKIRGISTAVFAWRAGTLDRGCPRSPNRFVARRATPSRGSTRGNRTAKLATTRQGLCGRPGNSPQRTPQASLPFDAGTT